MKVYVVWWDNGEQWEDHWQNIDGIFLTREVAEKYLDENYERYMSKSYDSKSHKMIDVVKWKLKPVEPKVCKTTGYEYCDDCDKYLDWLDNDCEPEDFCEEYSNEGYYGSYDEVSYDSWYIEEHEVLE